MIEKITKAKGGFKSRPRLHTLNPLHFEKIFKAIWEMKKLHYAENTIAVTNRRLKLIAKLANLDNPEVKEYLANINNFLVLKRKMCHIQN